MKRHFWEDWPENAEEARSLPTEILRGLNARWSKPQNLDTVVLAELLRRENEQPLASAINAGAAEVGRASRAVWWGVFAAVVSAVASLVSAVVSYLNWIQP